MQTHHIDQWLEIYMEYHEKDVALDIIHVIDFSAFESMEKCNNVTDEYQ